MATDEQKQNILQPKAGLPAGAGGISPALKPAAGTYIRTMKSDIEAMQKGKGAVPSAKPAIPVPPPPVVPPAGALPPVKPAPVLVSPPVKPSVSVPPLPAVPPVKQAVPTPSVVPPPAAISPKPAVSPVVPAVPPKPSAAIGGLPPIAPVVVPRPAVPSPAGGLPAAVPPFIAPRPAMPVPPVPRPPVIPTPPLPAGLPAEMPAEEIGGRERIIALAKKIAVFGGIGVVVAGILGMAVYYFIPPSAPLVPKTPTALFSVDDVKIINLKNQPKSISEEITSLSREALGEEKTFTQIIFKTETEQCFTLKRNCVTVADYLAPEEIYENLGVSAPFYLSGLTNDDFTLFVYHQDGITRFGAVAKVSEPQAIEEKLAEEETNFLGYWEPFVGSASVSPEGYKDSVYGNINIRYLNLPDPYLAVDYAFYPARNYLLLSTSRESIFALIDKLFEMEGK